MSASPAAVSPESFTNFGDLLRFLRKRADLSQRELALQVGYHYSYMSRIENNEHAPDTATLMARFVPALGLERDPVWTKRLLNLAAGEEKTMVPRREPALPSSSEREPDSGPRENDPLPDIFPVSLTPLLGREKEVAAVTNLLGRFPVRLVTLVGPPGVGKTRLAVQVASESAGLFAHGMSYIDLVPVAEADAFLPALAQQLDLNEIPEVSPLTRVVQALRHKNLLLVMDNFEQLADAAPQVHQLLSSAPGIKALVTSRESLHISGENEFTVPPLSLPQDSPERADEGDRNMMEFAAIRLFVERARAVQPEFQLTPENTGAVLEICRRLDGLPLAIELAAARVKTLSPQTMLNQFDRRFDWLSPNKRAGQTSRQTLRGAIEWSYNLLSEREQILLRRLSVFLDGRTLESVEGVCADEVDEPPGYGSTLHENELLDLLIQLADKSLLYSETVAGEARFHFLETIHDFAREKLRQAGEEAVFRNRHLAYYCHLAKRAEIELEGPDQVAWADRCEIEHNNIRAALDWSLRDGADLEMGIQLVASISFFWILHSHFLEGLDRIKIFLQKAQEGSNERILAKLLYRTADLHLNRAEFDAAVRLGGQAVALCRKINDKSMLATALYIQGDIFLALHDLKAARESLSEGVGICWEIHYPAMHDITLILLGWVLDQQGEHEAARATLKEGLAIAEGLSDQWAIAFGLRTFADMLRREENFPEAQMNFERSLEASRIIGDKVILGTVLSNLAILSNLQGQFAESERYAEEALGVFQAVGDEIQQPFPLRIMGYAAIHSGNLVRARILIQESLKGNRTLGDIPGQLACVVASAQYALAEKDVKKGVSLCALIESRIKADGVSLLEPDVKALRDVLAQGKKKLGRAAYEAAYQAGRSMILDDTIMELMAE